MGRIAWSVATALVGLFIFAGVAGALLVEIGRGFTERVGLLDALSTHQAQRLAHAEAMMRGEAPLPRWSYARALFDATIRTTAGTFFASPIKYAGNIVGFATGGNPYDDNAVYRLGQEAEEFWRGQFPGDRPRRFEFSHILVQGFTTSDFP